jgi:tripartite-type tricarboxylate transporter receptor subunit TctC
MLRWLLGGLVALWSTVALSQGFPERPVRIIVPLPPGGSPDTIARTLSQGLQGVWSHPVSCLAARKARVPTIFRARSVLSA